MIDDEIRSLFQEESREHLAVLEALLLDLESESDPGSRRGIIDHVFRHAHSIKGSARAVGLTELQELSQRLEDTLDDLRDDPENVTQEAIAKALSEFDALRNCYEAWETGGEAETEETPQTPPAPEEASETKSGPATPARGTPAPAVKPSEERFVVRVPAERLDRMLSLAGEIRVSQRGGEAVSGQIAALGELFGLMLADCKQLEERLRVGRDSSALKEDIDRLRVLMEGGLERFRQLQGDVRKKTFREDLLVEALEQDIRTARLVPLANLTDSMRRGVRDLMQSLGKPIRYEPNVGDILLDKAVMESLKDPLMHLIRNAIDHGIESPPERAAADKPKEGTISITASRRGESVLIRVSDDGGGINFDHIREKLKQSQSLDEAEVVELSEQELARFLFQAGFTTRQKATAVSGRGVGLDVVMDSIHRLQGTVELEQTSAAGTTFLITVPVTISTARILTVTSGGQWYGIPTTSTVRTGRLSPTALKELEGNLVLTVDGAPVRWVELSDLLGQPSRAGGDNKELRPYLLLLHEGRSLCIAVDEFEDEAEVILKSLEFPLAELDEVIGGTIRPDGSVQLVLDPAWLMSKAIQVPRRAMFPETPAAAMVLVVDDSPTTRSILRNLLSAAGYSVQTAADGVEAVERLRSRPFDIVVSDVEMPRMNGFELTRQVKSRFGLPVVLVTGMEKEEDRRQGLQAGADAYVVKSTFDDQSLLEILEQFV